MTVAVGVFGVTGVGKSTLLDRHVEACPWDRHVGGSSVIKALIAPASVRDFDRWPQVEQTSIRRRAIVELRRMRDRTEGALLVAGHFSLRNRASGILEPVLTDEDHDFFDALVLLDGEPHRVLEQTAGDSRPRHGQALEAVREHLAFERALAASTVARMKVPMLTITAPSIAERLRDLAEFLGGLRKEADP